MFSAPSRLAARAVFASALVCAMIAPASASVARAATPGTGAGIGAGTEERLDREPRAERLKALASALEAELWLEAEFPEGFTLAEAPEFFAAADEVFFEAQEQLLVFAYRSALTGRWIAWVAFDSAGRGVVHSAAVELGH